MEIELKYKINSAALAETILRDEWVQGFAQKSGELEIVQMKAAYFDTAERTLTKNGITFRVRAENARIIGTLKWANEDDGIKGLYIRNEVNVPLKDETMLLSPNPGIFAQSTEGRDLLDIIGNASLVNIFDIVFTRRRERLDFKDSILELAVDEGNIIAGDDSAPLAEAEIEIFSGSKENLLEFGEKFAEKFTLEAEARTKFERGMELLDSVESSR